MQATLGLMRSSRSCETRGPSGTSVASILALCVLMAACDRSGLTQPPVESDALATERKAETGSQVATDETPGSESPVVGPELNARYAEETDVDGWVKRFEREGRDVHDHRDRIIAALRLEPGMTVADLGAGTGLFTFPMARAVGPDGQVFAVDVQPYFLEHLDAKAAKEGIANVITVAADQHSPKLPAGAVDLAFFCDVYHHVEYPQTYLASLREAIAPGGRLVVIDYIRDEAKSPPWLLEHVRASPEVFRREIEQAGFTFVRAETFSSENFFFEFERPAQ